MNNRALQSLDSDKNLTVSYFSFLEKESNWDHYKHLSSSLQIHYWVDCQGKKNKLV